MKRDVARMNKQKKEMQRLRTSLAAVDEKILRDLAKRFKLVKKIGKIKARSGMTALQKREWLKGESKRRKLSKRLLLSQELITKVYKLIHQEAIRVQKS
ncbi:MAG: chorismate mutase [Oligoflexia bacterium]|nr:chorismate mutase [Oligoflexia bacterium]MBF0364424.1 chorismate mutase [Oligoflexia bacterium]